MEQCDIFSDLTSDMICEKRYVTFSIPDDVLDWAAEDHFGVSVDDLMESETFQSVIRSHVGCSCNKNSVIIGGNQYGVNLPDTIDTVGILSGPVLENGTETYTINGIVLSEAELDAIDQELDEIDGMTTAGDMRRWAAAVKKLLRGTNTGGRGKIKITSSKCLQAQRLDDTWFSKKYDRKKRSRRVVTARKNLDLFLNECLRQ